MDFITKLPKSKDPVTGITYDLIMVIVDRFTKYLIVVPFKETHTAEQLGHLLLDRLVRDHGVLIMIITDRDKLFTSNYWKTISAAMGTKPKMSTAYHPQTDSQTEQANQVLETYLQHYINQTHSNWVQLLPVAQLAINQHRSDSTKESLFSANFGQHTNIRMPSRASPNTEKVLQHDKLLQQTHTIVTTQEEHSLYILTESSRQDTGQKYQTVWHGNQSRDRQDKPGGARRSMHMHEQVSKVSRAHCAHELSTI